jgi:hypothetical protein
MRASGKMVRGREEVGPDPQEHLRDTDIDDGTSDDESVSSYSDRWIPEIGTPGFFWSCRGEPFGPLSRVEGGPWAASVFATVFS